MSRMADDLFELGKVLNNIRSSQLHNVNTSVEKKIRSLASTMVDDIRDDLKLNETYNGDIIARGLWDDLVTALTIYASAQIQAIKEGKGIKDDNE